MKCLITGITGFVGSHLAEYLTGQKQEVFGICRWRSSRENIKENDFKLLEADLTDLSSLIYVLKKVKPHFIFHLGAQSYVKSSFSNPLSTIQTNIIGTANLLEAIKITKQNPIIQVCSSSEVYGQVKKEDIPIKENCPFRPSSPYAVSKIGEDMLAYQYWITYGIKTIRTRAFTHTGPRRGEVFAISAFAKQVAEAEKGLKEPVIKVGNLKSIRTFCDVRDMVKAYWLLVNKCKIGEVYNIGGNRTETIGDALNILLSCSKIKFKIKVDPDLIRLSDVTLQIPCCDKFYKVTGWKPQIPLEKTLEDMLNYWRLKI